ncbi:RAC family serine/threonine-protein kinase homolog [Seminavis robusta]|uniref:RAC family serine/threonine-protein kinase homolog n=1 Tax=Seminavis robusta TaxID=568900 RepID=A0A9N8HHU5_9STRA|nr:RAC family serine/threonine-protein kinase homolog [Seminavis robusta]|eukprot:Sro556_g165910.1 RAC family serine/threonine-protein kinase homolog (788) ;mRNA; r:16094-18654
MEFWDALEDSQYLDAVASIRDGPKPIVRWEVPTTDQLQEWEGRVRTRKTLTCQPQSSEEDSGKDDLASVEPLTLDWYASCPIGFYFFSSYVKDQHAYATKNSTANNNSKNSSDQEQQQSSNTEAESSGIPVTPARMTSTKADELAYIRMNFLEDMLRFQRVAKTARPPSDGNRPKQVQLYVELLLDYIHPPKKNSGEEDGPVLPKMTHIREPDLHMPRCSATRRMGFETQAELEAALTINHDDNYQTNLVGLKGPLLKEFKGALVEWLEQVNNNLTSMHKAESEPLRTSNNNNTNNSDENAAPVQDLVADAAKALDVGASASSSSIPRAVLKRGKTDDTEATPTNKTSSGSKQTKSNGNLIAGLLPVMHKVEVLIYESLKRDYDALFQANSQPYMRMRNFLWYQDRRVIHDDFYVMRVLGRGGFGLVSACQKGTTGKLYAMKVMSKKRIKMKKSVQFVMNERKALAAVSESPFIINLKYSLHSDDEVYLVIDLMAGGDLGFHLHQRRRFSQNQCLYYAARIMLGLQALHDKHYVYRDLKPENCLLAEDGRVKLTDLGLATRTTPHLPSGVVGTRGYWAPEMHKRDGSGKRVPYNHVVDWFSFGCCLAEFISGKNPFRSEAAYKYGVERGEKDKHKAIDIAIREWEPELNPEVFPPDAADLCRRLFDKDPTARLGAHGGSTEIMAHPWFKSVDWEMVKTDRKKPPFIPPKDVNAASQHEIGNFQDDNSKTSKDVAFDESDERVYRDWDWINPKAYAIEVIEFLVHERDLGRPLLPESLSPDLCCCNIL